MLMVRATVTVSVKVSVRRRVRCRDSVGCRVSVGERRCHWIRRVPSNKSNAIFPIQVRG